MITVAGFSVTPVKALRLQHPSEVQLEPEGVVDNRRFYLVDGDGNLFNGKKGGRLMQVDAACDREATRLELRFPDGSAVADAVELGEPCVTDFWGRPVQSHLCEGPWSAALSAYLGREVRLARTDRPGEATDVHRVTIVSTASLDELARRSGEAAAGDARRFRMLVTLDGCRPHEEDEWEGRELRIGDAVLRVGGPVPRCVITTLSPDTGTRDVDTLRAIKAYRGLRDGRAIDFGVYAEVERPGRVRVGDQASLPALT